MVPQNEENDRRIEKHRRQRAGLDFQTLEVPCRVGGLSIPEDALVLLEDASNLLANLVFSEHGTAQQALDEIHALRGRCRHLLVVTISGLDEGSYDGETAEYIRSMAWLNDRLFDLADTAVELKHGKPVIRKGNLDDFS